MRGCLDHEDCFNSPGFTSLHAGTSPSLSRGGKWKKSDCPRETLFMGLSRLSLLHSFTCREVGVRDSSYTSTPQHTHAIFNSKRDNVRFNERKVCRIGNAGITDRETPTESVGRCSGDVMTFPLRSNWLICLKAMMLTPSMSLLPTWAPTLKIEKVKRLT